MSGASLGKAPIFMIRKLTLEKQQYRQLKTKHVVINRAPGYIKQLSSICCRLRAEYFAKHLIGEPEWSADMLALQGHFPKANPAGGGSRRKTKAGSNARVTMDGHLIKGDDDDDDQ